MTLQEIPTLNACLNGLASLLLLSGWLAIRKGEKKLHRNLMLAALFTSALFLTSYLYYHFNVQFVTRFEAEGFIRVVYFFILLTHIPLAALIGPFIVFIVWQAFKGNLERHKKFARIVLPVWLYVSVTGVLIYLFLSYLNSN